MYRRIAVPLLLVLALVVSAAGCGGDGGGSDGRLSVVAAFYPLAFVAERVGGTHVDVASLTASGAEPHDLELTPGDVGELGDADLVVYLRGFQPAVDEAVDRADPSRVVDATEATDLVRGDGGAADPHFWLDPTKLAEVAAAVGSALAEADPPHRTAYERGAAELRADLADLDTDLRTGLADCRDRALVTSHAAFGYLARRYGFEQIGITGLSPETEPSPSDLARVSDYVREHDVRTVWFETLVSSDVAETVADETGARTAVLDPIEGITDASAGRDYLAVMRANLRALREGQRCS